MVRYVDSLDGIRLDMLHGFFEGWRRSVSPEEHLELLRGSNHVVLAAYIPLLEVLPDYRGQGIGTELVRRLLHKLKGLYMVDVMCDRDMQPFYARLGMLPSMGMMMRRV